MVLVSVSIDEDLNALRGMVARRGLAWPQICDGKGPKTEIARLFNAGPGTHYVLDRVGSIAAKHKGSKGVEKIGSAVAELLAR